MKRSVSGFMMAVLFAAAAVLVAQCPAAAQQGTYSIDLPAALRLAGAQNLDIQISRQLLREAQANRTEAAEQFFPWISPGIGYHRLDGLAQSSSTGVIDEAHYQSYFPGGTLAAEVAIGDAIYNLLSAKQLVKAAGHALESQQLDANLAAAQGYFDLLGAKELVGVATEAVRISQDYQDQLHAAVGTGIAFKGDELRVKVQTEHYQIDLRQAVERRRVQAARLVEILHLDSTVDLDARDADFVPLTLTDTAVSQDSMVRQALASRPEPKQYQALLEAARQEKNGTVYGPLIPSISLSAYAGGFGGGPDTASQVFGGSAEILVGLGWKIGPGGLFDVGRIHAAEARVDRQKLSGEKLLDQITREVVESRARLTSLADQITAIRINVATAEETLRLTEERKQFGMGLVLEVIQAQQDLARARADYANVVTDYNKAQYALFRAIGGTSALSQQ